MILIFPNKYQCSRVDHITETLQVVHAWRWGLWQLSRGTEEKQRAAKGGGTAEKLKCYDHDQYV